MTPNAKRLVQIDCAYQKIFIIELRLGCHAPRGADDLTTTEERKILLVTDGVAVNRREGVLHRAGAQHCLPLVLRTTGTSGDDEVEDRALHRVRARQLREPGVIANLQAHSAETGIEYRSTPP